MQEIKFKPSTKKKEISPRKFLILNKRTDKIPGGAVLVDRSTDWGNPFIVGKHGTRSQVVKKYEKWIVTQKHLMDRLPELKRKDLVCWCAPKACHAEVLMRLANQTVFHQRKKLTEY